MSAFNSFWQLLIDFDSFWQLMTAFDSLQHLMAVYDSLWKFMTAFDSFLQFLTVNDSFWQPPCLSSSQELRSASFKKYTHFFVVNFFYWVLTIWEPYCAVLVFKIKSRTNKIQWQCQWQQNSSLPCVWHVFALTTKSLSIQRLILMRWNWHKQ